MRDQKLYESVGKYIDKYYIDKPDDIKLDKEMKSIFDRISEFRKKKATKKRDAEEDADIEIDESAVESFDVESMQKTKATDSMSSTLATNRNIESLMGQMDETFSQRLLRLIDERGLLHFLLYQREYIVSQLSWQQRLQYIQLTGSCRITRTASIWWSGCYLILILNRCTKQKLINCIK